MTKARKAPQKKSQQTTGRGLKIASALFVVLGILVALSMVVSSVLTTPTQTTQAPQSIPTITRAP